MSLTVLCLEKIDQNSSARKRTRDLSIKLQVLYQLKIEFDEKYYFFKILEKNYDTVQLSSHQPQVQYQSVSIR